MTQSILINWYPNEYSQGLCYNPFAVNLDKCMKNFNTLNDLFNKVCFSNKTKDLNLNVLNMITVINESRTLTKHILCDSNQECNNNKCWYECKNPKEHHVYEKIIFGILLHVLVKMVSI